MLEEIRRINDLAVALPGVVSRAANRAGMTVRVEGPGSSIEAVSMNLYIESPTEFNYAWGRYLLVGTGARVGIYPLDVFHLSPTAAAAERLRLALRDWFSTRQRGQQCLVDHFEDDGEHTLLVRRGTYPRTVPMWEGPEATYLTHTFRPVIEDVLAYESTTGLLRVKATHRGEREAYVKFFCAEVAGDLSLAERALSRSVYDLSPVLEGEFNYGGGGVITAVELVGVTFSVEGIAGGQISLRADNVNAAIASEQRGFSLDYGSLVRAQFRFHIEEPGSPPVTSTFFIHPPDGSDLAQSKYATIIEDYLRREGVRTL